MKNINILDFDGSITSQPELLSTFKDIINIKALQRYQQTARLWTSPKKFVAICKAAVTGLAPGFTLIGSGDFHHFSLGLISQNKEPLTVVLFDNHPDWIKPPHQYHCGTWVYALARLKNIRKIIIVGLESGDIDGEKFKDGDVESYLNQKIILLPYLAVEVMIEKNNKIVLKSSLNQDLDQGIAEIICQISTKQVYISVDKDCLRLEDAFTNWEQGTLPLSTVVAAIQAIKAKFEIVGADTVGDYSIPKFWSPLKWIGSWLDRKVSRSLTTKEMLKRNEIANIALIKALVCNA